MSAPFVWFDVMVHNGTQVSEFYASLFGWTVGPGMGDYQSWITDGEQPWAGVAAAEENVGGWLPYVMVEDLDIATKRAVELGGTVTREKTTGPAGTSVVITDPGGAQVALFTPTV